eukprot:14892-Heterococcus_DN1.PRE.4
MIRRAHLPNAADMWSIGVIAHCLLSGSPPFYAATVQELKRAVLQQEPTFSGRRWALLSDASRDFVTRLLQKDPAKRMTAAQAQCHQWLQQQQHECFAALRSSSSATSLSSQTSSEAEPLDEDVVRNLKAFQRSNLMKKVALEVVARTMAPAEMRRLQTEFEKADIRPQQELYTRLVLQQLNSSTARRYFRSVLSRTEGVSAAEIDTIFAGLDLSSSQEVCFTEFVAAALGRQQLDERRLRYAFDRIDYVLLVAVRVLQCCSDALIDSGLHSLSHTHSCLSTYTVVVLLLRVTDVQALCC